LFPPLIPVLAVEFGFPLWKLGLLISISSTVDGLGQTPMGILSDTRDRRYLLASGIGAMSIGTVLFALAPTVGTVVPTVPVAGYVIKGTYAVMIVAMIVLGVGSSVVHPTGYPLVTQNVDEDVKGRALGVWGSAAKFGDAAAPAMIGALLLVVAWGNILLTVGLIGVGYAVVLFFAMGSEAVQTRNTETDLEETDDDVAPSPFTIDRRLYIYPILLIFAFFAFRTVAVTSVNTFIPQFILAQYDYSYTVLDTLVTEESLANFYYSGLLLVAGASQLALGRVTDTVDHRLVIVGCTALAGVGLLTLSFLSISPLGLVVVLSIIGIGLWGLNPARDMLVSEITPQEWEGRTFGYLWTAAKLMGAVSPVVVGYIGDTAGIAQGFKYLGLIALLAGLPILLLFDERFHVPNPSSNQE
jgi:MFS family permease